MTLISYAIEAQVRFVAHNELLGTISVQTINLPHTTVTIIHETLNNDAIVHDLVGKDVASHLAVETGESLSLIARQSHSIVACGVFEVDCRSAASLGYILVPRGSSNLLLHQEAVSRMEDLYQLVTEAQAL